MDLNYNQKLSTLSFGQKSQVVLGLLFAQDAKLLILDDYSMGLDAGEGHEVYIKNKKISHKLRNLLFS
jgi:energy-coupling factor transporter ATP-binding protein EcfA2